MTDIFSADVPGSKPGFSTEAGVPSSDNLLAGPQSGREANSVAPVSGDHIPQDPTEPLTDELNPLDQYVRARFIHVANEPGMIDIANAAISTLAQRESSLRQKLLSLRAGVSQVLADPKQLPPVPLVYQKLSRLVDDPKSSANQVSDAVSTDPPSVSRLLQVVNSPFYGLRKRVDTVSDAVRLLGFQPVSDLVLAITAEGMFKAPPGVDARAVEALWHHSIGVGVAARVIGRRLRVKDVEQFFVAGLLHDIGKLVLLRSAPDAFQSTLDLAAQEGMLFLDAEDTVSGTNHTAIGVMMAEKWAFPPSLTEAVSLHHQPDQAKTNPQLVAAVHLADIIARALVIGSGGDALIPVLNRTALRTLGLDASKVKAVMDEVEQEYPDVEANLTGRAAA